MTDKPEVKISASQQFIEKLVFDYRAFWLVFFVAATLFLGYQATLIKPDTGFQKMIPQGHEYVKNFNKFRHYLPSPNAVRVVLEKKDGTIFDAGYLEKLQKLNDELFFLNGVDRAGMKSLWTKNVRWMAVTEEGFAGNSVIPDSYDGSQEALDQVRLNVSRSGQIGQLVANDFKSSILFLPLLDFDPKTGDALDYKKLSETLEKIRAEYSDDETTVRIIGFAKVIGNMIDAVTTVAMFFGLALLLTLVLLYWYSRCWIATILPLVCALIAIVWQLGILRLAGFGFDPFTILVPFLVFAISVSHAVQLANYMGLNSDRNICKKDTAIRSFRTIFAPGVTALISDGVGFFTIYFIPVGVIQELAIIASVGITMLIFANLILLPQLMSYTGISHSGIDHAKAREDKATKPAQFLSHFTQPGWARTMVIVAVTIMAASAYLRQDLKIGDLDKGAPEFRQDSVYNKDVAYVIANYATSSDVMAIMVETADDQCSSYTTINSIDRFHRMMEGVEGVQSVASAASGSKMVAALLNEANIKWSTIYRNGRALNGTLINLPSGLFFNEDKCSVNFIYMFLADHKAETLIRVTEVAKEWIEANKVEGVNYMLAAGNSGIEAATNDVISSKQSLMLVLVYSVVTLMVFITFRSIKAVFCIMLPLTITSVLCEALMAQLGIGVKVATLPVIALGVGIGVDYGIYIYSRLMHYFDEGMGLKEAYLNTMMTAGRAVTFTGMTLSMGVATWIFSPLKFQGDMGILLTFMFLWNMIGALTLLPALASFVFKDKNQIAEGVTASKATA
jgi:predicted RND superfamily exporter protein